MSLLILTIKYEVLNMFVHSQWLHKNIQCSIISLKIAKAMIEICVQASGRT